MSTGTTVHAGQVTGSINWTEVGEKSTAIWTSLNLSAERCPALMMQQNETSWYLIRVHVNLDAGLLYFGNCDTDHTNMHI